MAELIGTTAAAVQLAMCCTSLLEALQTIRHASSTIRRYKYQLNILESICESIQDNSLLCTREIGIQVRSIISSITNYIDEKLGKSRFLYFVRYFVMRSEFVEIFRILEEKKSSLVLSISNVTASTISDIRSDVKILRGSSAMEPSEKVEDIDPKSSGNLGIRPSPSTNGSSHQSNDGQQPRQQSAPTAERARTTAKGSYFGQEHRGRGLQLNGPEVKQKPREPLVESMGNLRWFGNIKNRAESTDWDGAPKNVQQNAPRFASGEFAEAYSGFWVGNIMEADGTQINGPTIG